MFSDHFQFAGLFLLLFSFQFSLLLWSELTLLLFFPFAFIFTSSLITHICFSSIETVNRPGLPTALLVESDPHGRALLPFIVQQLELDRW